METKNELVESMKTIPATPELSPENASKLKDEALDWALSHSIVMRSAKDMHLTHAPFTLIPSHFPRKQFELAQQLTIDFQTLVHKISLDHSYCLDLGQK